MDHGAFNHLWDMPDGSLRQTEVRTLIRMINAQRRIINELEEAADTALAAADYMERIVLKLAAVVGLNDE